jgi:hypothetical protein
MLGIPDWVIPWAPIPISYFPLVHRAGADPRTAEPPSLAYIPRGPFPSQEINSLGYWLPLWRGHKGSFPLGEWVQYRELPGRTAQGGQDGQPGAPPPDSG